MEKKVNPHPRQDCHVPAVLTLHMRRGGALFNLRPQRAKTSIFATLQV